MLNRYLNLTKIMEAMVENGTHPCDQTVRSIGRQLDKLYKALTPEERQVADFEDHIYFS